TTTDVPDDANNTNIPETGIVNGRGLRMRTLPDASAAVLTFLARNLEIDLIGRSPDNVWLNILTPDGGQGWVMSQFVDVDGDITTLPLSDSTVIGTSPDSTIQVDGTVVALGDGLRLRTLPSTNSGIIAILPENSGVQIIGRNAANDWIKVNTVESGEGWVATRYIETTITVANLPVPDDAFVPTPAPLVPPDFAVTNNRISGISATSGQIFQTGQALGNRPGVFSKVGDSLTVSTYYLYPLGWGTYNLRDFAYYQAALNYFSSSFATQSVAADNGWTTRNVLNASGAAGCQSGESALECEYRLRKPSVALIMLGTNDMPTLNNPGEYQQNLTRIVEISIAKGVIPVLHTIPPREDYPAPTGTYNDIIRTVARSFDVPLVDFFSAAIQLPNNGLTGDRVHPSIPAQDFAAAADFTAGNLQHGFTIRNLMTLQVLDMLWRQVISVYG
ncbi:MAG: SH3 domain-containing protein, partial [Aggregatilineales bacterium]